MRSTRRSTLCVAAVAAALSLGSLGLSAGGAAGDTPAGLEFADWTTVDAGVASGTLLGQPVSLSGSSVAATPTTVVDGTSTVFSSSSFSPPLATSDAVYFGGLAGNSYTVTFGAPTRDPVLHVANLASTLAFPAGTTITKLSGEDTFTVADSSVVGTLAGSTDASGTVVLSGVFESISFTTTPVYAGGAEDGIYLQVGAAPEPPPPPPPPPPGTSPPTNVTPPAIQSAGGSAYTCDPGTWENASSPFSYRWLVYRALAGTPTTIAETQDYTVDASVYGYPVACEVTVAGPDGPVTATSAQVSFSSAGLNTLPGAYGDVRIRGIDVYQSVQPNQGARMYGYKPDGAFARTLCGGGTPSSWTHGLGPCGLFGRDAQFVNYEGVTLDRYKRTTAVVYVDVANAVAGDPNLTYDLELSATRTGTRTSLGAPVVRKVKDPPRSDTPWVREFERDGDFTGPDRQGIPITLPTAWYSSGGTIQLHAELRFPDRLALGTAGYGTRECDAPGCEANDAFTLNDIPFQDFPQLRIASLQLRRTTNGQGALRAPDDVLAKALRIYPGGDRVAVSPYQADLDITGATDNTTAIAVPGTANLICSGPAGTFGTAGPKVTTRGCRWNAVGTIVQRWMTDNPARRTVLRGSRLSPAPYDVVFGVHEYASGEGFQEPGWTVGNISAVSVREPRTAATTPYFTATDNTRPYTAAAHELGHILTAPHASACNGADGTEAWPEVDRALRGAEQGRLQSTKFVRVARGLRGATYRATVDGPFDTGAGGTTDPTLFDLMSYCAGGDTDAAEGTGWISGRNWNRFSYELGQLATRLGGRALVGLKRARAAAAGPSAAAFAVGFAGGATGGSITTVVPADGDDAIPASEPSSPYRLRSLDARGTVLLDAGVTIQRSTDHDGGGGGPFTGPVARGAAAVELVVGGTVIDRVERSRAPTVRLTAPGRRTRVTGGGRLEVRWQASDPDRDPLEATVDFSADDGRTWRTVSSGPSSGRATVAGRLLSASRRARIRVAVSDGFSEATVTSPRLRTEGTRPRVRIQSPLPDEVLRAGERVTLAGSAFDDQGYPLTGRALTWTAGGRKLGHGAQVRARLPRGARRLRLVARDRSGHRGVATLRLSVGARTLRLLSASVPLRVPRGARSVEVRLRASARAVLTVAGRRFRIGAKGARVKVPLPRRPAVGVLKVPFRLAARGRGVVGTVRGTFSVVRS